LHTAGMLTMQGVSAALAGGVAQLTSPGTAMTVMAVASITVTVTLAPSLLRLRAASRDRQHPEVSPPRERQSGVNSP